ncbi:MAG: serine protease Do [Gammaproteobacteria bacterium]|jgi:predicted metalloprotease with PDZ domain|nr:serine protease Do [Gammaproteobacteria bacterium]
MNVLAKALTLQFQRVEKRSNLVVSSRSAVVLLVLLACAVMTAALVLRPSLFAAIRPQGETPARQLDEAIGATVEPLDPATARSLGLAPQTRGLVVTSIASGGPAAGAGVRTGDVVVGIDQSVSSIKDLGAGIQRNGNALTVTLNRHGQSVIVPLRVGAPAQRPAFLEEQELR